MMFAAFTLTVAGIKASDSLIGDGGGESLDGNCPPEMVRVLSSSGGFCIDRYEASAGEKCLVENPGNQADTQVNLQEKDCVPVSKKGRIPWTNISQSQAAEACAKAGKRLAGNGEWHRAALGTPDAGAGWSAEDCQVNSNWEAQPGASGSGQACVSSAGANDMVGNVWEWVEGTVSDGKFEGADLPNQGYVASADENGIADETGEKADENYYSDYFWLKRTGKKGIARGGYWSNKEKAGVYAFYLVSQPSFAGDGIGFRCVK